MQYRNDIANTYEYKERLAIIQLETGKDDITASQLTLMEINERGRPHPKAVPAARQKENRPPRSGGRIEELVAERDAVKKRMQAESSPERQKELMLRWTELSMQIIKERNNVS